MADGSIEMNGNPRDLFTEANFRKFERSWDDGRVATAFFRGTATGGGTTVDNNQRLKVASLYHEWKDDEVKGGEEPYLDAAIVGWNRKFCYATLRKTFKGQLTLCFVTRFSKVRDKKIADGPMTFLRTFTMKTAVVNHLITTGRSHQLTFYFKTYRSLEFWFHCRTSPLYSHLRTIKV